MFMQNQTIDSPIGKLIKSNENLNNFMNCKPDVETSRLLLEWFPKLTDMDLDDLISDIKFHMMDYVEYLVKGLFEIGLIEINLKADK